MNERQAETSTTPHLCVVGHPNQGKSSIVATLAENDSVQIGVESGTTRQADRFEFLIDRKPALVLIDTPGFQRPRQVLAWLQAESVAPGDRPARVRTFLATPENRQRFPDEVALLTPIMAGAGILYVVDAAQPVTTSDEAEMEILRWTGMPRMAVINPMASTAVDPVWQRTLDQSFQWVRTFNPLTATLPARQALLRAIGELSPGWYGAIQRLRHHLELRDDERLQQVSHELAGYWCRQMTERQALSALDGNKPERAQQRLIQVLNQRETEYFQQLQAQWGHRHSELDQQPEWELDQSQLMHTETWYLWGLKQRELMLVAASAGAATGLAVDVGLGGSALFLGALSGGVIGSASGWWATRQLPGKKLGWLPLSREQAFAGPVRHPNFPLVTMARALTGTQQLWLRPHARRDAIALHAAASDWSRQEQRQLLQWAVRLQSPLRGGLRASRKERWRTVHQEALEHWIQQTLATRLHKAYQDQEQQVWQSHEY